MAKRGLPIRAGGIGKRLDFVYRVSGITGGLSIRDIAKFVIEIGIAIVVFHCERPPISFYLCGRYRRMNHRAILELTEFSFRTRPVNPATQSVVNTHPKSVCNQK